MKSFLVTFLVSTAASICLWQFGLGSRIWPAHPFFAAIGTAIAAGVAIQLLLSQKRPAQTTKN
jgi:cation transport regulator ChaC